MDIVIKTLGLNYLSHNIDAFIDILKNEPFEYWNKDHFLKPLYKKYSLSLYVTCQKKLVGYIIASEKEQNAYIHKFMIKQEYRNLNLGKKLQLYFEENAIKNGYNSILLSVIKSNKKAQNFYLKNKYSIITQKTDAVNQINLLVMKKQLK